jgi:hypothetical protein
MVALNHLELPYLLLQLGFQTFELDALAFQVVRPEPDLQWVHGPLLVPALSVAYFILMQGHDLLTGSNGLFQNMYTIKDLGHLANIVGNFVVMRYCSYIYHDAAGLDLQQSKIRVPIRYEELDVQRCCQLVGGRGEVITRYNLESREKFSMSVFDTDAICIARRFLKSSEWTSAYRTRWESQSSHRTRS